MDTTSILGDARPRDVESLLKKSNPVWAALYRAWLAARAPGEHLQGFDFLAAGGTADKQLRKDWTRTLNAGFKGFANEIGELKDLGRGKSSGRGNAGDTLAGLVRERETESGADSSQYEGAVRAVEEQLVQGQGVLRVPELRTLKEEVYKVADTIGGCTVWTERDSALAVLQEAAGTYRTAEGELRRITQETAAIAAEAGQWRTARQLTAERAAQLRASAAALQSALDTWGEASVGLGQAIEKAAQKCWSWAQAETRANSREAFSTVHDTTFNVLFGCRMAVRAIQVALHAAAIVYPGVNVGAAAIGLAWEGVEAIVKEAMVRLDAQDLDTVLDRGAGMGVRRTTDHETSETVGEMASLGTDLGHVAAELGVKGAELAGTIGEGSLHAAEVALPGVGIGVVLFQTGVDIYNFVEEKRSNPQIVQVVSDEEITVVRETVQWAYERKTQQDLDFSQVRYHGRDPSSGSLMVTIAGVFGTIGSDGFFVPQGQTDLEAHERGYQAALRTAARLRDDIGFDQVSLEDYDAARNCYRVQVEGIWASLWPEGQWEWDDLQQGTTYVLKRTVPQFDDQPDERQGATDEEWEATEA